MLEHSHEDHHDAGSSAAVRRRLAIALLIAIATAFLEVGGAAWSGSLALLADAGHVWADSSALLIALLAARLAARPHSLRWTFGFHRAEVLAAALNALALLAVAALIAWRAAERLRTVHTVHGEGLLVVALAGLAANSLQLYVLRGSESLNVRAARLHVLADLGGSIAAVAAGVVVSLTGETRVDALVSLVIVALVVPAALRLLNEAFPVLMSKAPDDLDLPAVRAVLLALPGVLGVHDMHAWTVAPGFVAFACHLQLSHGADMMAVVNEASELLRRGFGLEHVTIQPELPAVLSL